MPRTLIRDSPDLRRLRDEGYELDVRSNLLVIAHVPYLNSASEIKYGVLVSELTLAGDITTRPSTHAVDFQGEAPHDKDGRPLPVVAGTGHRRLGDGLEVNWTLSQKPPGGYSDYYHKIATYVNILSAPAQAIDRSVTARTFPVAKEVSDSSVFRYVDTATSRAGINVVSDRLALPRVAIVGLGGTGSYILDFVAKTEVREIHLYDGDQFLQHNAFRFPGATSEEELQAKKTKVEHLASVYSKMRSGIIPCGHITDSNVAELRGMGFVFLALDQGDAKKLIIQELQDHGVPFVDVGMGVNEVETGGSLLGLLRITTSTPAKWDHVPARIPMGHVGVADAYSRNIQIAELNALGAALAVIRWKKYVGFYLDLEHEQHAVYQIDGNTLTNEEVA